MAGTGLVAAVVAVAFLVSQPLAQATNVRVATMNTRTFTHPIRYYEVYFAGLRRLPGTGSTFYNLPGYTAMKCAFRASRTGVFCLAEIAGTGGFVAFSAERTSATRAQIRWVFIDASLSTPVGNADQFTVTLA